MASQPKTFCEGARKKEEQSVLFRETLLGGNHVDVLLVVPSVECHLAFNNSKKGVVIAHADALSWENFGSPLSHDDVAGDNALSTVLFYA